MEKYCPLIAPKRLKVQLGSPSQGSEHPRMFRQHFAEVTFPGTFRYKPVSEPVFKIMKPVWAGGFWIFWVFYFENQFQNRFYLSETGLYQKVLENVGGAKWLRYILGCSDPWEGDPHPGLAFKENLYWVQIFCFLCLKTAPLFYQKYIAFFRKKYGQVFSVPVIQNSFHMERASNDKSTLQLSKYLSWKTSLLAWSLFSICLVSHGLRYFFLAPFEFVRLLQTS